MSHFMFGARSLWALSTVHPALRDVMHEAIHLTPIDFAILEGHRNESDQNRAFSEGKSQVRWPHGKHNQLPSLAVDITPWPMDWRDLDRFKVLAGVIFAAAALEDVAIRWGGDWDGDGRMSDETFRDLGHFELVQGPVTGGQ